LKWVKQIGMKEIKSFHTRHKTSSSPEIDLFEWMVKIGDDVSLPRQVFEFSNNICIWQGSKGIKFANV